MKRSNKIIFNIIVALVLLTVIICICSKFFHFGRVEFTDNAQIKQLIVPVNSRVQGFISCINFKEYSYVKKGDILLVIDDTEYRYRLAQAQAQYQNAIAGKVAMQSSINTTQNNILVSQSSINEAKVRLNNDKTEYERYSSLYNQNAVTKQQYDAVKTNYEASKERYELLLRQSKSTWLVKEEQKVRLNQNEAAIKLAEAAVQLAELNLSYT